jgi:hypothetical protein
MISGLAQMFIMLVVVQELFMLEVVLHPEEMVVVAIVVHIQITVVQVKSTPEVVVAVQLVA